MASGGKGKACPLQNDHHGSHYGKHSGKSGKHAIPGSSPAHLRMILKRADKLGLSDKQRSKVGDLLVQAQTDAAKAHAQMEVTVSEFKAKMRSGKMTEKDMRAYAKRLGELKTAKLLAHLLACNEAKSVLTDEQREKMKAMRRGGKNWRGKK
jgi:Spy/CpxP family protein refolding chaperone